MSKERSDAPTAAARSFSNQEQFQLASRQDKIVGCKQVSVLLQADSAYAELMAEAISPELGAEYKVSAINSGVEISFAARDDEDFKLRSGSLRRYETIFRKMVALVEQHL